MLNDKGFDLWADGYDQSVGLSDDQGTYPFAGYRQVLNTIYNAVLSSGQKTVLDVGFGTGTLTTKLYEQGCTIFGQDFSPRMIELAQAKMPEAQLHCGDFAKGLVPALTRRKYDAIIATYSLHHLDDGQKAAFLRTLLSLLKEGGCIYIGDVAFPTRAALEQCRIQNGDDWDESEIYFVYDELKAVFPNLQFQQMSPCAGLMTLTARPPKGRIIFLNGVTSSGKTSIVEAIQEKRNILVVANDLFEQMVGDRYLCEDYWGNLAKVIRLMYHTAKLYSDMGHDVLIDGILVERPQIASHYAQLREIMQDNPLSIVEVSCPLDICRQRNIARGDRYEMQSAEQAALMSPEIEYALRVETDRQSPEECAAQIIRGLL